jgi:hypothetical protein
MRRSRQEPYGGSLTLIADSSTDLGWRHGGLPQTVAKLPELLRKSTA